MFYLFALLWENNKVSLGYVEPEQTYQMIRAFSIIIAFRRKFKNFPYAAMQF